MDHEPRPVPIELSFEYTTDPIVSMALQGWVKGDFPILQDALIACVKNLVAQNNILTDEAVKMRERVPTKYLLPA